MNSQVDETYYDGLHEECGVFGVYDLSMKSLILKNLKNSKEISGLDMSATRRQVRAMDRMYSR